MNRDPHYVSIVERLAGKLDREIFEFAANALIQRDIPDLVPIPGGTDAGQDGATSGAGPFLVATTSQSYRRNVKTNLASHSASGDSRRSFVLATREVVSETKRRNLRALAKKHGYNVHHIYDREALAIRLYRDSAVCEELLGLPGRPLALSKVPPNPRPIPTEEILARKDSFEWLKSSQGDALLVGEPGSGKTFLLRALVLSGWGLFLADLDRTALANAIRDQEPSVIVVDDPYATADCLGLLRHLRDDTGADFRIVASSWPGDQEELAASLEIPSSQVHGLRLLTRDEMVKLVNLLGIIGPASFLRELVTQAAGRPGLAVTLTQLCFQGEVEDVVSGTALRKRLGSKMEKLVGRTATHLLGAIALGGKAGLDVLTLANVLGRPLDEVSTSTRLLAAGGVLQPVYPERLGVWPPVLRFALIRHVFFSGWGDLPYHVVAAAIPDPVALADALIGAASQGANILDLWEYVVAAESIEVWSSYAWLGRTQTLSILRQRLDLLRNIADAALYYAPKTTIPLLLTKVVQANSSHHSRAPWPIDTLAHWLSRANPNSPDPIARRQTLVLEFSRWVNATACSDIAPAFEALWIALKPGFEDTETDPGAGRTVTFKSGILRIPDLKKILELWQEVLAIVRERMEEVRWDGLFSALHYWIYPDHAMFGKPAGEENTECMHAVAREIVKDIAEATQGIPSVQQRARAEAAKLGLEISIQPNELYDALFPAERYGDDWQELQMRQLADGLAQLPPEEVVDCIISTESEAARIRKTYPRYTPNLCRILSGQSSGQLPWVDLLVARDGHPDLLEPFLIAAAEADEPGWTSRFQELLQTPYGRVVSMVGVTLATAPEAFLDQIVAGLGASEASWINTWCLRGEIPPSTMRRLLAHSDESISTNAAVGEWLAEPKGSVRSGLQDLWSAAMLRARSESYYLGEILPSNPDLGKQWMTAFMAEDHSSGFLELESVIDSVSSALSAGDRKALLGALRETYHHTKFAQRLVGYNTEIYLELLNRSDLSGLHQAPLAGDITEEQWLPLAEAATDAGMTAEEIFFASEGRGRSWNGPASAMWIQEKEKLKVLSNSTNQVARDIAEFGTRVLDGRIAGALKEEEAEAIFGR